MDELTRINRWLRKKGYHVALDEEDRGRLITITLYHAHARSQQKVTAHTEVVAAVKRLCSQQGLHVPETRPGRPTGKSEVPPGPRLPTAS